MIEENITMQYRLKVSIRCVTAEFISRAFNFRVIGKHSQRRAATSRCIAACLWLKNRNGTKESEPLIQTP